MVRITSLSSTTLLPEEIGAKGPVLLHHGMRSDGLAWFATNTPTATPTFLPQTLFDAGYDVWILNGRGTLHSREHEYLDPDADDEYWDFASDELGLEDVPAFINEILETRKAEGSCKKVSIVTHSKGATNALLALNEFPTTASERVQTLVNHAPCFIPDKERFVGESTADLDTDDDYYDDYYYDDYFGFDYIAYYQELATLADELTSSNF
jgi:pimeloyl-ACP methyl ester carboxylesterase